MVTITIHLHNGNTLEFKVKWRNDALHIFDVVGVDNDQIDFVTARDGEDVFMLVDDNGYCWEPCSEGPY